MDSDDIHRAIAPYLGQARTINDIDKAAQAIQRLYQQSGYPTTSIDVPNQDIDSGVIRIVVDESAIRRVNVVDAQYFLPSDIRERFPSLKSGTVFNVNDLQRDVQKANRVNPDLKVVPALQASPVPGEIDVDLNVADALPLHGGVETTNYHTENTSELRFGADLRYGNLWQRNHEVSLQVQLTPENTDEVRVIAGSYLFPVNDRGGKVATYVVSSDSELAVALSDINVIGNGEIFGARWVQPIMQSPRAVQSISLGGDYKDFQEDLVLPGDVVVETPISYTSWSAQYNLYHRGDNVVDSFTTGFTFGSRLLVNDTEEFQLKRSQADTGFTLWRLSWERAYTLFDTWRFSHSVRGQITESPLVSNEQLSAGGVNSVRGYFESQIQGDTGWIANLELTTPALEPPWPWFNSSIAYLFYDAARLKINESLADQEDRFAISSTGLGVRAQLLDSWNFKVEGGYPLKEQGSIEKGDFRARASLRVEF